TLLASANCTAVALRTMDALEAISAKSLEGPIKKFILAGHSRCGLTAAYAAEIDPRVIGIISIGAPAMNFPEQIARDEEFIINAMLRPGDAKTENGRRLLRVFDPYTFRKKLVAPKLFITGTNDGVCMPPTLGCYYPGLPDPKWLLQLPNTAHETEPTHPKTGATVYAFARAIASR